MLAAVLTSSVLAVCGSASAQMGAGPMAPPPSSSQPAAAPAPPPKPKPKAAPVPPRTTLAGSWKLNPKDSDDPQQRVAPRKPPTRFRTILNLVWAIPGDILEVTRAATPEEATRIREDTRIPRSLPGRNSAWRGRQGHCRQSQDAAVDPSSGTRYGGSENSPTEVDLTDDHFHQLALYTDGRKLAKQTDDAHEAILRTGAE